MSKIKTVRCKSGVMGWQGKIQDIYKDFNEFDLYCNIYHIHTKLGFKNPLVMWTSNVRLRGSMNPNDLELVKSRVKS